MTAITPMAGTAMNDPMTIAAMISCAKVLFLSLWVSSHEYDGEGEGDQVGVGVTMTVSTGAGAHDGCGVGVQAGTVGEVAGADGVLSHWRATMAGGDVDVINSKGMPVEIATLVTMLGSGTNAGSAAADAICIVRKTESTENMFGNIVQDAS